MIDRREFIARVAASAVITVLGPAQAQPAGKVWRIGYIGGTPPTTPEVARIFGAFVETLRDRGYVEEGIL
jgi:aspartate aminotransferase-like enzyme